MFSAIISVILGALSLFAAAVPRVLPVFGLVFAINAILKEKKKIGNKRKTVKVLSIIGLVTNGFVTLMFLLKGFLK